MVPVVKINSEGFARWVSDGVHFSFSWLLDASPGGRQDKPFPGCGELEWDRDLRGPNGWS